VKTVIEMAREAELIMETDCTTPWMEDHDLTPYIERFAELVRADAIADEREACAKVCETEWSNVAERMYGEECAAAIRARSNT